MTGVLTMKPMLTSPKGVLAAAAVALTCRTATGPTTTGPTVNGPTLAGATPAGRAVAGRVVAAAGVLTGAVVGALPGAPAQAADTCSAPQRVEYETPGLNTVLQVRLCISHGSPFRSAYARVSWTDGGDSSADGNRKFDQLDIHYALRKDGLPEADGVCHLALQVNTIESGTFTCSRTASRLSRQTGGWSAGGHISYNLDRDGAGTFRTDLHSSPTVPT